MDNKIPKNWEKTKLKKYINIIRGVNYNSNEVCENQQKNYTGILRANNISNNGILNFRKIVYVDNKNIKNEQLIQKGDILLAMSSGSKVLVGKAAQAQKDYDYAFGAFCSIVRPKNINPKLLGYYFLTDYYRNRISYLSTGIGINNLRKEYIENLEIIVPLNPHEQQEIVDVLDAMSEIIRLREECIKHAKDLIPAIFQEMFGNLKPTTQLNSLISLEYGKALKAENRNGNGEYPVYGSNGIVGYHDAYITEGQTIIVGRKGSCGKLNLTYKSCYPIDTCFYIKQKVQIDWYYLFYALQELNVENMLKDAVIPGINRNDYLRNKIRLAPEQEQKQFAQKAIEIENYIQEQEEERKNARQMFQSLLHLAFTGELTRRAYENI